MIELITSTLFVGSFVNVRMNGFFSTFASTVISSPIEMSRIVLTNPVGMSEDKDSPSGMSDGLRLLIFRLFVST